MDLDMKFPATCPRGHALNSEKDVYLNRERKRLDCAECRRASCREHRARNKDAARIRTYAYRLRRKGKVAEADALLATVPPRAPHTRVRVSKPWPERAAVPERKPEKVEKPRVHSPRRPGPPCSFSPEQREDILRLRRAGKTYSEIARRVGRATSSVVRFVDALRREGVDVPGRTYVKPSLVGHRTPDAKRRVRVQAKFTPVYAVECPSCNGAGCAACRDSGVLPRVPSCETWEDTPLGKGWE